MKISTRQLAAGGILLAVCLASQFFKNLSVFITGPIVNTALIIAGYSCGPAIGIILSVITPVTAFIITGSPVMSAVPVIIPCIMVGNALLAVMSSIPQAKQDKKKLAAAIVAGAGIKALFMGIVISNIILTSFLPEKMQKMLPVLKAQFSTTQFITAIIGGVYAMIILAALGAAGIDISKNN